MILCSDVTHRGMTLTTFLALNTLFNKSEDENFKKSEGELEKNYFEATCSPTLMSCIKKSCASYEET